MLRENTFVLAGRLATYAGTGLLDRALTPADNVRVVLSHYVPAENLEHYGRIARYVSEKRTVITPQEFFRYYSSNGDRRPIQGRSVVFSFDDGLMSSYRAAKEVLGPLGIKAIFFVPTGALELETEEEMRRFAWDRIEHRDRPIDSLRPEQYVPMTRKELLELQRDGNAVFPHTHSHINISEIATLDDVEVELRKPKEILEDILQTPCDAFAFPVGNEKVLSAYSYHHVSQIYKYSFSALMGANTEATHPLLFHRDSIHAWSSLSHVRSIMSGTYDAYHLMRKRRITRRVALPARSVADAVAANGSTAVSSSRRDFVELIARKLNDAGADYVFLHGCDSEHEVDSDVDIAVSRESVALVDATIRTGACGRLLQCLHYADPWCRYYVLASDEPDRRYRELDVGCDPWGIGKDGPALQVALAHAVDEGGLRVPAPAAQTLYLAIKKARKHRDGEADRKVLLDAFDRDPRGSSELLVRHLGRPGGDLARALEARQQTIEHELEGVRRSLRRRWASPFKLARRVGFGTRRIVGRTLRPTGLVVHITAPDGAGKSTLADQLEKQATRGGPFRRFARYHHRPGLLPPPARLLHRAPSSGEMPHGKAPSGQAGSLLRLGYLWLDTLIGWAPKIGVPQMRSALVLVERGWLDLAVDPARYRLSSSAAVTRFLGRFLPKPSMVLLLEAPAEVLIGRKPELDEAEITRQFEAWRRQSDSNRFFSIDASRSEEAVSKQALDSIDDRLASRQHDLQSCELALACIGDLRVGGKPYRIISAPRGPTMRGPRWVLPSRRGAPGPRRAQLYRPARARQHAPALALELVQRLGLRQLGTHVAMAPERGAGPMIADRLGLPDVELSAAVTGGHARGARALLSVWHEGRLVAFAKVAREEAAKLEHERRVLNVLAQLELETLLVPSVIDFFEWRDCGILLLKPFQVRDRANRPLGTAELTGLSELARLSSALAPVLGEHPERIPVHGDFAPWNCAPAADSRLMLWDWEEARLGLPLEDLFQWRLWRLLRFGHGTVSDLVRTAIEPAPYVSGLCERLSISTALAPVALRASLEHRLEVLAPDSVPEAACLLTRALEELAAAGG